MVSTADPAAGLRTQVDSVMNWDEKYMVHIICYEMYDMHYNICNITCTLKWLQMVQGPMNATMMNY